MKPVPEKQCEIIERQLHIIFSRNLLDSLSQEFTKSSYAEKIETLGKVVFHGYDLLALVNEYEESYSLEGYKHIIDNLKPTLIQLLSFQNTGNPSSLSIQKEFDKKSKKEIIETLVANFRN